MDRAYGVNYAWEDLKAYFAEFLPWLEVEGADRWFIFSSNPAPDPWSKVPNASYLLREDGALTPLGTQLAEMLVAGSAN